LVEIWDWNLNFLNYLVLSNWSTQQSYYFADKKNVEEELNK
ncbi:unnamed protein product, partial [marine sediment metagenome]